MNRKDRAIMKLTKVILWDLLQSEWGLQSTNSIIQGQQRSKVSNL